MKYVIWVLVFVAYLLCLVGIFRLASNITAGIEVEVQVEREVYGEIVYRTQEVPFNELEIVRMTIGMLGLYIAVGVGFITADYISRAWVGEEERKLSTRDRWIKIGLFTGFFVAFSFLFNIHTIDEVFALLGWIFMALTCASTILVSAALQKVFGNKQEEAEIKTGEV